MVGYTYTKIIYLWKNR